MKRALALCAAFWSLGWGCRSGAPRPLPPVKEAAEAPVKEVPMEWKGANCGLARPEALIVSDAQAWRELWQRAFGQPAPELDFKGRYAAAVFVGAVPTGGYSVDFLEPQVEGMRQVVRYRINKPGKGAFVIQAFTQPWHIRAFDGNGKGVDLQPAP